MKTFAKSLSVLHGLLSIALMISIASFSTPTVAKTGGKQFSLSVSASPTYKLPDGSITTTPTVGAQIQAPVPVVAKFKNLAPPDTANSNFGSVTLSMTVPGMSIVGATAAAAYIIDGDVDHGDDIRREGREGVHLDVLRSSRGDTT